MKEVNRSSATWINYFNYDKTGWKTHTIPINDTAKHVLDGSPCECGAITDVDHPSCVLHFAFDGRDVIERVEEGKDL